MPKSHLEYVDWLDNRNDLIWPKPPQLQPIKARAHLKPLKGIRAVLWNLYGTLLHVTDGELLLYHHASVDARELAAVGGAAPVTYAVTNNHLQVVEALCNAGCEWI